MNKLSSRFGFGKFAITFGLVVMITAQLIVLLNLNSRIQYGVGMRILSGFIIIVTLIIFVVIFSYCVVITKDAITLKILWARHVLHTEDISRIQIALVGGWIPLLGYNIILYPDYGLFFGIFFRNNHQLTKAIIEVAYRKNQGVEIDPVLLDSYGHPPYRVFSNNSDGEITE